MSTKVIVGDCRDVLRTLPEVSVQCIATSPPYWNLRDYGVENQIGSESTPEEYVDNLVRIFREVRRVLRDDGTVWLNLGDCYANDAKWGGMTGGKHARDLHGQTGVGRSKVRTGLKAKDLVGIPWRVAFALQDAGWWLRSDVVWEKPNALPDPTMDRPTRSHEYVFLLTKSAKYYYDADAIREPHTTPGAENNTADWKSRTSTNVTKNDTLSALDPRHRRYAGAAAARPPGYYGHALGRNKRTVWRILTEAFPEAHFAVMPTALVAPCIMAGSKPGDTVLDPFCGAGTVGLVAKLLGRNFIGIELNAEYAKLAERRIECPESIGKDADLIPGQRTLFDLME